MRCEVQSLNERDPRSLIPAGLGEATCREVGGRREDAVGEHRRSGRRQIHMTLMTRARCVLQWGLQRVAMGRPGARPERISRCGWGAANAPLKSEWIVIAHHHGAVNRKMSGVLTAHHASRVGRVRSPDGNLRRLARVSPARGGVRRVKTSLVIEVKL